MPEPADDSILVRLAEPDDFDALWPLLDDMGKTDDRAAAARRFARLRADHAHRLIVAERGASIVGYAWAQEYGAHLRTGRSTARLHDLYVDPRFRRGGVGRLLLIAIELWCELRAVSWLQWQASAAAAPFYERLGYHGDPCPDPAHPFFEIAFDDRDEP